MGNGVRTDIQALRGLAVSLVLLYHADLGSIPSGFLGVDIFFVISGYLITGLVKKAVLNGDFSFSEFYFRRAKRLLPAAYVTFFLTSLAAPFVLNAHELKDFTEQVIGAVTFTANVVLLSQAGYFQGAADLKPLLHTWSLSLEEQYYLLLPLFLVLVKPRLWAVGAILLLALSLGLCLLFVASKPIATFYLLPTRGWELGIGSLAAITDLSAEPIKRVARFLFWPSIATLVVLPAWPTGQPHPGLDAIMVCLATVVVIIRRHPKMDSNIGVRSLAKVGDISYSLYLAHWPFFAFLKNAAVGPVGIRENLLTLALGIVAAILLYRFVELPTRSLQVGPSRRLVAGGLLASMSVMAVPVVIAATPVSGPDYTQLRRPNDGFSTICTFEKDNFSPLAECRNSDHPTLLVWGDSYAMHLVTGIVASSNTGVVQATRGMCGPFANLAPMSDVFYLHPWANSCLEFNRAVLAYIEKSKSIKTVVLSSPFIQYLQPASGKHHWRSVKVEDDGSLGVHDASPDLAVAAMGDTIKRLRALGKKVVMVGPPPASGFNIGTCQERRNQGKLVIGAPMSDCSVPLVDYHRYFALTNEFLAKVQASTGVRTISFDRLLCDEIRCVTEVDGTLLYVDAGHLTHEGSRMIFGRIEPLVEDIDRQP